MVKTIFCILVLFLFAGGFGLVFGQGLVDPMRPAPYRASAATSVEKTESQLRSKLQLTAILMGNNRSVAVINGEVLQVGQEILGYRLMRIAENQVVLKNGAQQLVLSGQEQVVKTPPAREK